VNKPKKREVSIGGFKEAERPGILIKQCSTSKGLLKSILKKPNNRIEEKKEQVEKPTKNQLPPLIKSISKRNKQLIKPISHKKTNSAGQSKIKISLSANNPDLVGLINKNIHKASTNRHYMKLLPNLTERNMLRVSTQVDVVQKINDYSSVGSKNELLYVTLKK